MKVKTNRSPELRWKSKDKDGNVWFEGKFNLVDFKSEKASDEETAKHLQHMLNACCSLNPDFLSKWKGFAVETTLEFDRDWGLGSSSTLIYCLAHWAEVDPFDLQFKALGGSGYDIACADADGPVLYQNTPEYIEYDPVAFRPPFSDHLNFLHLGKKQSSREAIEKYNKLGKKASSAISTCDKLTQDMIQAADIESFMHLVEEHESLIASIIEEEKIKDKLFSDFPGAIKSLGAWGGDFVLVASPLQREEICRYFSRKGYETLLSWEDMVYDVRS